MKEKSIKTVKHKNIYKKKRAKNKRPTWDAGSDLFLTANIYLL